MCGIVGYLGPKDPAEVVFSGLRRLEYRGYDSAGISMFDSRAQLQVVKTAGKIADLETHYRKSAPSLSGPLRSPAIGHTRWATHGPPIERNAHPHLSGHGTVAIVHNGIIENYTALKSRLTDEGFKFASDTDSEVLAHLIEAHVDGEFSRAVAAALRLVRGTFGIAVISSRYPGEIVAARRGSPIAVGLCKGETVIASDISAIVGHTQQVVFLQDDDLIHATSEGVEFSTIHETPVQRSTTTIDWKVDEIERGGYEHFMLKEIHEQPVAMANAMRGRLLPDEGSSKLSGMQLDSAAMARIQRIIIAACGTSLYAGMVGKYLFEDLAGLPVDVEQAAEFRYRNPIIQPDSCMLAISQSGETADTLAAVREAKRKGSMVMGICNVVGSTIAREAERGVYLHAGPEIGVASTKAFTCQVVVQAMMALAFGRTRRLSAKAGTQLVRALEALPTLVEAVLAKSDEIKAIAARHAEAENCFFIGRGYLYPAALEGALKLKEISYIHAEGYHAAELKHGPIALLKDDVPVIALAPDVPGRAKTLSNIEECRARRSPVIAIATAGDSEVANLAEDVIEIPPCCEYLVPIPVVVVEQLLAYHVANYRGCSIDQPRNLAKSVTVE